MHAKVDLNKICIFYLSVKYTVGFCLFFWETIQHFRNGEKVLKV